MNAKLFASIRCLCHTAVRSLALALSTSTVRRITRCACVLSHSTGKSHYSISHLYEVASEPLRSPTTRAHQWDSLCKKKLRKKLESARDVQARQNALETAGKLNPSTGPPKGEKLDKRMRFR